MLAANQTYSFIGAGPKNRCPITVGGAHAAAPNRPTGRLFQFEPMSLMSVFATRKNAIKYLHWGDCLTIIFDIIGSTSWPPR